MTRDERLAALGKCSGPQRAAVHRLERYGKATENLMRRYGHGQGTMDALVRRGLAQMDVQYGGSGRTFRIYRSVEAD